jgi:hypothetical protein
MRPVLVIVAALLISATPPIDSETALGADSVTVSVGLLDSAVAHIDRLELSLALTEATRDSALAVLALDATGKPLAIPESFWRKWYVWATLYGLGVLTGALVW